MEILKTINPEGVTELEAEKFRVRHAARAIVFDTDGNIALLHVGTYNHHKLPGGGVEEGEDILTALKRECIEEIGCAIEVGIEVGKIIEYRREISEKQYSDTFVATVVGGKGEPKFDAGEQALNFSVKWVPLDEALRILKSDIPNDYLGAFIVERDITFIEKAKEKAAGM